MGMLFCLQPKSSGDTRPSRTEGRALRTKRAGRPLTSKTENSAAHVKAVLDRD